MRGIPSTDLAKEDQRSVRTKRRHRAVFARSAHGARRWFAVALVLLLGMNSRAGSPHGVVEMSGAQREAACVASASEEENLAARFQRAFPTFQTGAVALLTEGSDADSEGLHAFLEQTGVSQPRIARCEGGRLVIWLSGLRQDPTAELGAIRGLTVDWIGLLDAEAARAQLVALRRDDGWLMALRTQTPFELCKIYADSKSPQPFDAPRPGHSAAEIAVCEALDRSEIAACLKLADEDKEKHDACMAGLRERIVGAR